MIKNQEIDILKNGISEPLLNIMARCGISIKDISPITIAHAQAYMKYQEQQEEEENKNIIEKEIENKIRSVFKQIGL